MKFPNFTVQFDDCSIEESKSMFIRPIEKVRLYALKPTTKPPNHIVILHRTTYSPSESISVILLSSPPKPQLFPSLFPIVPNTIRSRATSFFLVFFVQKKKKKTRKKKSQTKKKNLDQNHLLQYIFTIQPTHQPLLHSIIHIERSC